MNPGSTQDERRFLERTSNEVTGSQGGRVAKAKRNASPEEEGNKQYHSRYRLIRAMRAYRLFTTTQTKIYLA